MTDNIINIGKVKLDMEYYPGEDFYCDGAVEDELLEAVKSQDNSNYKAVIEEKNNWPFLYHLSELRGNIVSWIPMDKNTKVLEIGSGCGAITSCIASKCGELTCIDLSKKRSEINAYRNKNNDNICIKVGNFQDIEPSLDSDYDLILLIGVFEYAAAYIGSDSPYTKFLNIIKSHLKQGGRIVIAIENRMGLKYLAGCMEDHLGSYFTGIENYPNGGVVRTFTRPALEKIFKACQVNEYTFYYPYPDYKFMHTLFSDERLPYKGELTTNLRNFDRDRVLLFDEKNAFDSIIDDGEFPLFSNSYLVVIGAKPETIYSRFSNDRAKKYAIRTDIVNRDNKCAIKYPVFDETKEHINNIKKAYDLLKARYEGSNLKICPCENDGEGLLFEYIEGETLEEILDRNLENEDKFLEIIKEYYEQISFNENNESIKPVTDKDIIFSNIIVDKDGKWNVIDYEWTYEEIIPANEILERAMYCYLMGSDKRRQLNIQEIVKKVLGTENTFNIEKLNLNEINFQNTVTDQFKSLSEMRDSINYEVLPITDAIKRYELSQQEKKIQIYFDRGNGFSEADSTFEMPEMVYNNNEDKSGATSDYNKSLIKIKLTDEIINLRFDPKMKPCMIRNFTVYLEKANGDRIEFPAKKLVHNGVNMPNNVVGFSHNDPNFTLSLKYLKKQKACGNSFDGDSLVIEYSDVM